MILLDSRVASLRFRKLLKEFSKSHPEIRFDLPKFSVWYIWIFFFTLLSIPFMLIIASLEITRSRSKPLATLTMFIPIFITRKSFSYEPNEEISQESNLEKLTSEKEYFSKSPLYGSSPIGTWVGFSSPLLPFIALFPNSGEEKYVKLVGFNSGSFCPQFGTNLAKLPFLNSLGDTYENTLCHYFDLLTQIKIGMDSKTEILIRCSEINRNPLTTFFSLLKRIRADISKVSRNLIFQRKYIWHVRVQTGDSLSPLSIFDLENPNNGYYADPFLFKFKNNIFLFVEEYTFSTLKGVITVFKFNGHGFDRMGVCLEEDFHISFPNVFKDGEDIYMIPETSSNRDIRLYRALDFPMVWEFSSEILSNISAVDSVIYKQSDYYYLLTTVDSFNLGDHSTSLTLYKSREIISSNWSQAKLNPVLRDAEKGRNAGRYDPSINEYYRVAQASEFGTYGKKVKLFEIENFDLTEYSESELQLPQLIYPVDAQGHHHVSSIPDFLAFDYSKFEK